ncbi:MAG: T9SS type A sorting domain-containing protein [Bacteroidetes bacterium]|nr:T9SS type A sorting domain-containing protein [Bacteroidota bacterium]
MLLFNQKLKIKFITNATSVLLLTILQVLSLWSQGIGIMRYYDIYPPAGTYYGQSLGTAVGRESGSEGYYDETYRLICGTDISPISQNAIALHATITIQVGYVQTVHKPVSIVGYPAGPNPTNISQAWSTLTSSTVFRSGITMGSTGQYVLQFDRTNSNDLPFLQSIESSLGQQYFNFGLRLSTISDENLNHTAIWFSSVVLLIQWETKDVTVKNNFAGGKFKTDNLPDHLNVPETGITFPWLKNSTHTLLAYDNQTPPDGYTRSFDNWSSNISGEQPTTLLQRSITVTANGIFSANFKKLFNVGFQNQYVSVGNGGQIVVNGGTVSSPTQSFTVRQDNTILAQALNTTINGIDYTFTNWTRNGVVVSTNTSQTFTPTDHSTYTANFQGVPRPVTNLQSVGSIGQNVRITWTENPNPNVYYTIYRKRPQDGNYVLVGGASHGTSTWQDPDYTVGTKYNGDNLAYRVTCVYTVEGTSSFVGITIFGNEIYGYEKGVALNNNPSDTPSEYVLSDNYPNPFNPTTEIQYALPVDGNVSLKVFDIFGKEVVTLVDESKSAGYYTVEFDASKLSSGIYFYKLVAGTYVATKKLAVMK